ncbi:branched-chain-amino-acid aminotransferase-like protein 2 [Acanthaster planci]|uniref:Branched-chain-amino-acid aminotransferase-like protein 2 n=1 Tax=Acanthaster planci TaxID=133434 RepID=A0A8B7ZLX8_ACAPL|nr:branched-chain-amino-acid aminotransferase-like protein 2 [Acanthaster planci]
MADSMSRMFLWCVPRTCSTVLLKCLSFVQGLQVVNQPYYCAYFIGPEGKKSDWPDMNDPVDKRLFETYYHASSNDDRGFDEKNCTYGWIRDQILEASYRDKTILLCKDMAHYLNSRYNELPGDFKYSFLIRHPVKVHLSWKKYLEKLLPSLTNDIQSLPEYIFPAGRGFKELYELVMYVEKHLGQDPVIIDSDDLLADPEGILSAYCREMGIPYSRELLSWDSSDSVTKTWITPKILMNANKVAGFFDKAF